MGRKMEETCDLERCKTLAGARRPRRLHPLRLAVARQRQGRNDGLLSGALIILVLIFTGPGNLQAEVPVKKVGTYDQLVAAIREVRTESQKRVEQAVAQEKVREAWETGKLIDEHVLQYKERADYDQQVLVRLASDLGTSKTELYYMLEFARAYPIFPHARKLSWSEYRELLVVNVPEKREALAARAEKENWGRARLRSEVRNVTHGGKAAPEEVLNAKPGIPGTYRVVKTPKGVLVLDLGFSDYFASAGTARLKEGDIVKFEKGAFEKSSSGTEALYTYQIDVIEVIDGDTFKAAIPLGFGFTTVQKLRLRGLDAPEIASADGKEAKAFLERKLRSTEAEKQEKSLPLASGLSTSSILIRTVKSDKYDRYLADVFIDNRLKTADRSQSEVRSPQSDFVYLNQALLDEGLAVRVEE